MWFAPIMSFFPHRTPILRMYKSANTWSKQLPNSLWSPRLHMVTKTMRYACSFFYHMVNTSVPGSHGQLWAPRYPGTSPCFPIQPWQSTWEYSARRIWSACPQWDVISCYDCGKYFNSWSTPHYHVLYRSVAFSMVTKYTARQNIPPSAECFIAPNGTDFLHLSNSWRAMMYMALSLTECVTRSHVPECELFFSFSFCCAWPLFKCRRQWRTWRFIWCRCWKWRWIRYYFRLGRPATSLSEF